jgi:hypothetical protein
MKRNGLSPLALFLAISVPLLITLFIVEIALDRLAFMTRPGESFRDLRIAVIHCLFAGYLPAAYQGLLRRSRDTLERLRPVLDLNAAEFQVRRESIGRYGPRWTVLVVLVALVFAFGVPLITPPVPEAPWNPTTWSPEVIWHRVLGPPVAIGIGLLLTAVALESRRLSGVAVRLGPIDLTETDRLTPFTHQGLIHAALVLGLFSIGSLFMLDSGFGVLVSGIAIVAVPVAAMGLVAPIRGVRARIAAAKTQELEWTNEAVRRAREGLKTGDGTPGQLADLLAYRNAVSQITEWPIAPAGYARFGLYLLLPVAAWILGALVESLIEAVFF